MPEVTNPTNQEHYRRLSENAERCQKITALCQRYKVGKVDVNIAGRMQRVDLAEHAIMSGMTAEETELIALRATGNGPHAVGDAQVIEASLLLSTGFTESEVGEHFDQRTMNEACGKQWRGYTLHAAMDACITAAGRSYHGSHASSDFIRTTLEADQELRAKAGGFSTLALSNILENTANKALVASYNAQEVIWPHICSIKNSNDFKPHARYRLDVQGAYQKVGADGELKHVGMTDAKFSTQLETYGALISLPRQDMINDDLDAFMQIPTGLGRLGAVRIEELVFVELLSNPNSFFSVANGNLTSGGGSELGITALTTITQKFMNQVDSNGKPILISPKVLLVPTTLKVTADDLFTETQVATRLDSSDEQQIARNPHAGLFRPYASPYLNNTNITDQDGKAITGQSDTAWFLFADPKVRAAICIAFLNNNRLPTIESATTDFSTLGMQWRGIHDIDVGMEDPAAAQKSAGV